MPGLVKILCPYELAAYLTIKFERLPRSEVQEAEKYLGYPYVWGGSSPSTSFDCSGFVSYVINHCGNGWSVGRLTANGLMGVCDIIPKKALPNQEI